MTVYDTLYKFIEEVLIKEPCIKTVSLYYREQKLWEFPKEKAKTARGTRGVKAFEFELYSNGEARIIHGYDFIE